MRYTYGDFLGDVDQIVGQINSLGKRYDLIVGLSRGGLILGVFLSHKLKTPFHALNKPFIKGSNFEGSKFRSEFLLESLNQNKKILLCEDLIDSGDTLRHIKKAWDDGLMVSKVGNVDVAVLIENVDVKMECFSGRKISRKIEPAWVSFFWEE